MKSRTNVIGNYLKQRREAAGLLQREVAAHVGVSIATISRIEGGTILPTADVLAKLGDCLQLDLTELLAKLGNRTKRDLPEFEDYLREKYGMAEQTIAEVAAYFRQAAQLADDAVSTDS